MSKLREQLVDRMIAIYGMENEIVIDFCNLCERFENSEWNDKCLTIMVEAHEAAPVFTLENDE